MVLSPTCLSSMIQVSIVLAVNLIFNCANKNSDDYITVFRIALNNFGKITHPFIIPKMKRQLKITVNFLKFNDLIFSGSIIFMVECRLSVYTMYDVYKKYVTKRYE